MFPYLNIFGLQIPMYGLCMALAIGLSILFSCIRSRRRGESWEDLLSIAVFAVLLGMLGAKLLYIFVSYSFKQMGEEIARVGFFRFFIDSGVVFYGGLLGGILGAFVGAKIYKKKLVRYCDAIVPTLPLAHAIGRVGCFCAGCCYGRVTDSWIGVCFPHSVAGLSPTLKVIPTQLIETGANLIVFAFLIWFTRKRRKGYTTLFVYLIIYAVERFFIEYLRGDDYRGIFGSFSTSQWISIALIVAGVVGLILTNEYYKRRPLAPGAIGAGEYIGVFGGKKAALEPAETDPAAEELSAEPESASGDPEAELDEKQRERLAGFADEILPGEHIGDDDGK